MSRQLEASITSKCIKFLDDLISKGYYIYYEHRSGGSGFAYKKGIPDLFIVINGVHIECEMKTPWGGLSTMQEKWKNKFEQLHIRYMCPTSFEEFKQHIIKFIKEILNETIS